MFRSGRVLLHKIILLECRIIVQSCRNFKFLATLISRLLLTAAGAFRFRFKQV